MYNNLQHEARNAILSIEGAMKEIAKECKRIEKAVKEVCTNNNQRFISPTGSDVVRADNAGSGHYGAPRGSRKHSGVDYLGVVGQGIIAPLWGEQKVARVANPYENDPLTGILIESDWIAIKIFYVKPIERMIGKIVNQGDLIATLQDVRKRYPDEPNMKPHCHVEVVSMDLEVLSRL